MLFHEVGLLTSRSTHNLEGHQSSFPSLRSPACLPCEVPIEHGVPREGHAQNLVCGEALYQQESLTVSAPFSPALADDCTL